MKMWRTQYLLFIHCSKLHLFINSSPFNLLTISCPYESEYQNSLKYICRGTRPSTCLQQALITSDNKENGRFRLDDDTVLGKFTVSITRLTRRDSGLYLCGVQRNSGRDVFSARSLKARSTLEHWTLRSSAVSCSTCSTSNLTHKDSICLKQIINNEPGPVSDSAAVYELVCALT
uniref:Immunoglobulin V-set domain-containing protein n=1 Tax=Pundamilia nyererei TaxID=303518 RepID=A0A3B4H5B2_9CICH